MSYFRSKKVRALSLLPIFALLLLGATASSPHAQALSLSGKNKLFQKANKAHYKSDLNSAIELYERLWKSGARSEALAFNLGLSYAKQGHLGKAKAFVLQSERLGSQGKHSKALARIESTLASQRKGLSYAGGESGELKRPSLLLQSWLHTPQPYPVALALIFCTILFFTACILLVIQKPGPWRVTVGLTSAVLGITLCTLATVYTLRIGSFLPGAPSVVTDRTAELRDGPDRRADRAGSISEGELAYVLIRQAEFYKIRTSRGKEAWIRSSQLQLIE